MRKLAIAVVTVLAAFASVLLGSGAVQATNAPATITHLDLSGVSCASATFCAAVGERDETGSPSNVLPLAEIWNGARWQGVDGDRAAAATAQPCPRGLRLVWSAPALRHLHGL